IKGNGNFGSIPIDAQHTGNLASQVSSGMTQSMYESLTGHNSDTSTPLVPLAPWDMATLNPAGGTAPSGSHDPNVTPGAGGPSGSWNWVGMPGMRSVDAITINAPSGTFLLPLFRAYDDGMGKGTSPTGSPFSTSPTSTTSLGLGYQAALGSGSNYYFNIVDFVPVQITTVSGQSTNKEVWVTPGAVVVDVNQIIGGTPQLASPPTSWSTFSSIFIAPKLTQ